MRKASLALASVLAIAGAFAFAGCGSGDAAHPSIGGGSQVDVKGAPPGPTPASDSSCIQPACVNVPLPPTSNAIRLSQDQWTNSVRDLLRLPAVVVSTAYPPDPSVGKQDFGYDPKQLKVSVELWRFYRNSAEELATTVTSDPGALDQILPDAAKTGTDIEARVQAFVAAFLPRVYRRPVTSDEIAKIVTEAEASAALDPAPDPDSDFVLKTKLVITAALQSPYFLYRVEGGEDAVVNGRARLKPYEIAQKLAFMLWNTTPDDTVTGQAASGALATNEGVGALARDMLTDPRAEPVLTDFHDRLFLVGQYGSLLRKPDLFPLYYQNAGYDAAEDVRRTIHDLVISNPGGVKELYSSKVAYVNAALAPLYGIDPSTVPALVADPTSFARVEMTGDRQGLLTHVGWLATEGHDKDPASILRGVYVARRLLCLQLGAPPPEAAGADPAKSPGVTNRERVYDTTKAPLCQTCHWVTINPLGMAFEKFDALGVFRTTDNGQAVDATGSVDQFGSFDGAVSLMNEALTSERPHVCYAAHWNAYLNGQPTVEPRSLWLSPIAKKSLAGASAKDVVAEIVQTDAFLTVSR